MKRSHRNRDTDSAKGNLCSHLRKDNRKGLLLNDDNRCRNKFFSCQFDLNISRMCSSEYCKIPEIGKYPNFHSSKRHFVFPCGLNGNKPPHLPKVIIPKDCFIKSLQSSYGKSTPTSRIWVGKFCPQTTVDQLKKEFKRFGIIKQIEHIKGNSFAYVQFKRVDDAVAAVKYMKKVSFGHTKQKLTVEFAVEKHCGKPKSTYSSKSNSIINSFVKFVKSGESLHTAKSSDDNENKEGTSSGCFDDNALPSDEPAGALRSAVI